MTTAVAWTSISPETISSPATTAVEAARRPSIVSPKLGEGSLLARIVVVVLIVGPGT